VIEHEVSAGYYIPIWIEMVYNPDMAGFYTRKGDSGYTGVLGEGRLPKHHPRMEAIGSNG
jgi:hypothetical protein